MDVKERYRLVLDENDRQSRRLIAMGADFRHSVQEAGLWKATARAMFLIPGGVFMLAMTSIQRHLLKR